jgi:thioredoxin-related protein
LKKTDTKNALQMFYFRLLLSLFLLSASLSAQGIQFEHGAWAEALAKAKAENKIVFLDAFATWCGPCKMLTNQTFPDSSVGAYFNAHFVNVKMDMEKGEGVELARKYGVEVYPTLLFFQPDGVVAHRAAGFYPVAQFLELGKTATDPTRNLYALETRYRSGDRDRVFLRQLIEARAAAYDPRAAALANEYLDQETDLNTPENKQIILRFASDPTSKAFKYLVQNRKAFEPQVTEGEVSQFVDQVFQNYLQNNPTLQPDQLQRIFATCYPEQGEQAASLYRLTYFQQRSDFAKYATSAVDHFKRFPSENADELNEAAFLFSESATNKTLLEPALAWAEKAAMLQETPYNRLTQAKILVKLGRKKEAVKAAQRSVELAKAAGVDDAQGQLLLKQLGN